MGTTVRKRVRNARKLDDLWLVPGGSNHGGHKHVLQLEHGRQRVQAPDLDAGVVGARPNMKLAEQWNRQDTLS